MYSYMFVKNKKHATFDTYAYFVLDRKELNRYKKTQMVYIF